MATRPTEPNLQKMTHDEYLQWDKQMREPGKYKPTAHQSRVLSQVVSTVPTSEALPGNHTDMDRGF